MTLTADRLREVLDYDPYTGIFKWKPRLKVHNPPDGIAGSMNGARGYIDITIDGRKYAAARLAFLYMQGEWPAQHMDHCNLDTGDNRWINLRPATRSENMCNMARRANRSGFKNIAQLDGRNKCWRVYVAGAKIKAFACIGQALKYRNDMLRKHHREFARFE